MTAVPREEEGGHAGGNIVSPRDIPAAAEGAAAAVVRGRGEGDGSLRGSCSAPFGCLLPLLDRRDDSNS
jgi:hypothetical protein